MALFEFYTDKPKPYPAWKAIGKLEFNLTARTLLWVAVLITDDFDRTRESIKHLLESNPTSDNIITTISALLQAKHGVQVSTDTILPSQDSIRMSANANINEPTVELLRLLIFHKDNTSASIVTFVDNLLPNCTVELVEEIVSVCKSLSYPNPAEFTKLGVQFMSDSLLFADSTFRTLFPANPSADIVEIKSTAQINTHLRNHLIDNITDGILTYSPPTFKLV